MALAIAAVALFVTRHWDGFLRLLRAVRFAAQLGFTIEPQTLAAVRALAPKIKSISAERIRDELTVPILYVSHDRSEVERLAEDVVELG